MATKIETFRFSSLEKPTPTNNSPLNNTNVDIGKQIERSINPINSGLLLTEANASMLNIILDSSKEYVLFARALENNHGSSMATKRLKSLYGITKIGMISLGMPHQSGPFSTKIIKRFRIPREIKRHLPTLFAHLVQGFDYKSRLYTDDTLRTVFTVLRLYESIRLDPVYDTSTITDDKGSLSAYETVDISDIPGVHPKFMGLSIRETYRMFLKDSNYGALKRKKYSERHNRELEELTKQDKSLMFQLTDKAGPRGYAMGTLIKQSHDIGPNLRMLLAELLKPFGKHTLFLDTLEDAQRYEGEDADTETGSEHYHTGNGILGRLSVFPDKGGKHRLMAICNYWIQCPLRIYHHILMDVLRTFPMDSSFDQNKGAMRVKHATRSYLVESLDIEDATNSILALMMYDSFWSMDSVFASIWYSIVKGMTFLNPDNGAVVSYITGQPMGLYTSFPALSHWHNDMYQFCYYLHSGKTDKIFRHYQVLGDDSSCWNPNVTKVYKGICKYLNIGISASKSMESKKGIRIAEFAKRQFRNGREVTGLSPTLCYSVFGSDKYECTLNGIPILLQTLASRGFSIPGRTLTLQAFKRAIKCSVPKATMHRIETLYFFSKVQLYMWSGVNQIDISNANHSVVVFKEGPEQVHRIIKDLIRIKAEDLEDFGTVYASLALLPFQQERSTAKFLPFLPEGNLPKIYKLLIRHKVQGYRQLYDRLAFQLGKQVPPDFSAILELKDFECLRTERKQCIFKKPSRDVLRKQSKRMLQLNKLMSICEIYVREQI